MIGTLVLINHGAGADIFFGFIIITMIICHFLATGILIYLKKITKLELLYPIFFLIIFIGFYSRYLKFIWDLKSI